MPGVLLPGNLYHSSTPCCNPDFLPTLQALTLNLAFGGFTMINNNKHTLEHKPFIKGIMHMQHAEQSKGAAIVHRDS